MPADPFDALRALGASPPVHPRRGFAADLRRRVARDLGLDPTTGAAMDTTFKPPTRADVTAYLIVRDSRAALAWYREVFGAEQTMEPIVMDDGKVGHVELRIGETTLQMADEFPEMGIVAPKGRSGVSFTVYVPDVDATYERAVAMGAVGERPPEDQFYGDRAGWFADPFGHVWSVNTWLGADG